MKKKQAIKIIAAAGAAIGGAHMFQDGNMVYAAEADLENQDSMVFDNDSAEDSTENSVADSTEDSAAASDADSAEDTGAADHADSSESQQDSSADNVEETVSEA